jgi:leucyl-tRNA synthetase
MSKSKGNVVMPEVVSDKYGIDTARFFLCSLASPDKDIDWSDNGIQGSLRFIRKIYGLLDNIKFGKDSSELLEKLNKSIKNISEQIENLEYRKSKR